MSWSYQFNFFLFIDCHTHQFNFMWDETSKVVSFSFFVSLIYTITWFHVVGVFTLASMLDILSTWTSHYVWKIASVVRITLLSCSFCTAMPIILLFPTDVLHFIRWFIPVNIVLVTIFGSIIGLIVATIVRPPYPYFKFTIIQIGIGKCSIYTSFVVRSHVWSLFDFYIMQLTVS